MNRSHSQTGFTLLEMVVALLLLAVLSTMTFQGVQGLWRIDQNSRANGAQSAALQRAWQVIGSDLMALRPRLFADGRGGWQRAFETGAGETIVRFSRAGGAQLGANPSGLERINYRLEDRQLVRESWPATSAASGQPAQLWLLDGVESVLVETLAADNRYTANWPPLNERHSDQSLPRMIRATIALVGGDTTSKLFPGVSDSYPRDRSAADSGDNGSGGADE